MALPSRKNDFSHNKSPLPALALAASARFTLIVTRLLFIGFGLLVFALCFLPWRQFISGNGRVIAFDPLERRINIEAQLSGRVKHLHVTEGQRVKMGDLIIEIQDNDPNLVSNLKAQREAIESRRDFALGRVESPLPRSLNRKWPNGKPSTVQSSALLWRKLPLKRPS